MTAKSRSARQAVWSAGVIVFVHVAVAVYFRARGLSLEPSNLWQILPPDLLQSRLLESLWYLPSQPPLYNLILGVLAKVSGGDYLGPLWWLHVGMGALTLLCIQGLIARFSGQPKAAFCLALLFAFNPALLAYEIYPLYSQTTAFLITLHCWSVAGLTRRVAPFQVVVCFLSMLALIMVRTSYLPYLVFPEIAYVFFVLRSRARFIAGSLAIFSLIVPFGWCLKNSQQHQFFGLTCWSGMNLYHKASALYAPAQLQQLANEGVIDRIATVPSSADASEYQPFGFTRQSVIPVLSRDDRNNVNYPAVCRTYGRNAVRLIEHDPWRFLSTTWEAAQLYTVPADNYLKITPDVPAYNRLDAAWQEWVLGTSLWGFGSSYNLSPVIVVLLVGVGIGSVVEISKLVARRRSVEDARRNVAIYVIHGFILYNAAVSILAEYGENNRFRYDVEPISYVVACLFVLRMGSAVARRVRPLALSAHTPPRAPCG